MSNTKEISPAGLRQQVLDIEGRVGSNTPITAIQEKQLFKQLDRVQSSVKQLQGKGSVDFLEDLPKKITQLYGIIHSCAIDTEVKQALTEATHLQNKLQNDEDIDQGVNRLKEKLQEIRKRHALGGENLKVAGYVANKAEQYLKARSLGQQAPQLVNQFNLLEIQKLHYKNEEIDDELANELFDIAEGYFTAQNKDLMKRYYLLPERAKERIKLHYGRLAITSPTENGLKTAQAFIATAYDLASGEDSHPYFSEEELKLLFAEGQKIQDS